MYKNFFGLREAPFTIAPDPRYLYLSERHREALAHLLYGFKYEGGFVLLTGEVGTGKTTVCRCLLEQIPAETDVALILNPCLTVTELLASICQEFAIEAPPTDSVKLLVDRINHFLLACHQRGRKAVLVLDEAQNLSCEVLEQIRLLTNLETNTRKLLQIIMLGQPELLEKLALPQMRQLAQRITARYHLGPLSEAEVKGYVRHRWTVAGGRGNLLTDRQLGRLYSLSKGIPRVINVICDRVLLGAYSQDVRQISMAILEQAAREVKGKGRRKGTFSGKRAVLLGCVLIMVGIIGGGYFAWSQFFRNGSSPENSSAPVTLSPLATRQNDPPPAVLPPAATMVSHAVGAVATIEAPAAGESITDGDGSVIASSETGGMENNATSDNKEPMTWRWQEGAVPTLDNAFSDLFARWRLSYPTSEPSPCQFAQKRGLRCLFKQGSLADLYNTNRPAVLKMQSDDGVQFPATLVQFDRPAATLMIAGEARQTTAEQIALHWTGNYTVFWKPPSDFAGVVRPGYKGEMVPWLAKRLAEVGETSEISGSIYNRELALCVKKFQIKAGLVPDGIAGVQTIIQLNTRTDKDIPRLHDDIP